MIGIARWNLVDCAAEMLVHGGRGAADNRVLAWRVSVKAPDCTTLDDGLTRTNEKPDDRTSEAVRLLRYGKYGDKICPLLTQETRIARKKRRKYENSVTRG